MGNFKKKSKNDGSARKQLHKALFGATLSSAIFCPEKRTKGYSLLSLALSWVLCNTVVLKAYVVAPKLQIFESRDCKEEAVFLEEIVGC